MLSLVTLGQECKTHSRRGVIYANKKGHCCNLHKDILPTFVKGRGIFSMVIISQWLIYLCFVLLKNCTLNI